MELLKRYLGFGWNDTFGHNSMEGNSSGVYRTLKGLRNNLNGWGGGWLHDERDSAEKEKNQKFIVTCRNLVFDIIV